MTINPLGAVVLADGENPRTFSATARTAISGGDLVVVSGTANGVSSGADSFITTDLVVDIVHDSDRCNGIALNTIGSGTNNLVTVATRGMYIVRSAGVISGGQEVVPFSGTIQGVTSFTSGTVGSVALLETSIGRSMMDTASGTALYTVISLNV